MYALLAGKFKYCLWHLHAQSEKNSHFQLYLKGNVSIITLEIKLVLMRYNMKGCWFDWSTWITQPFNICKFYEKCPEFATFFPLCRRWIWFWTIIYWIISFFDDFDVNIAEYIRMYAFFKELKKCDLTQIYIFKRFYWKY